MSHKSVVSEIVYYIRKQKRYWLIPLIIIFLVFAILVVISQTVPIVSPFIYTLF